jgi:quercetin dioxygenase-like cupin family protein
MKSIGTMSVLAALALAAVSSSRAAPPAGEHKVTTPADLKWVDVPPQIPKGAKVAALYGDLTKPGLFIVRLKFPANYKIPPHWHPTDENVTVLSGAFAVGMGDKLDPAAKALSPGTFISMPAKMHHFALTKEETVVELSAMGPFAITYVNPADDPSKQAAR